MLRKKSLRRAFSLLEVSIVVVVIGIIIAGVTQSRAILSKIKLASARTQTQNSPVASIEDLALWLDATSPNAFSEKNKRHRTAVTNWHDINPSKTQKIVANQPTANRKPYYYTNCINGLPCIKFNDPDANMPDTTYVDHFTIETTATRPALAQTSYTVFVVEQRQIEDARYFLGGQGDGSAHFSRLSLGYQPDDAGIRFGHGNGTGSNNYYLATNIVEEFFAPAPRLHVFMNGYGYDGNDIRFVSGLKSYATNGSAVITTQGSDPSPRLTPVGSPVNNDLSASWNNMALRIGRDPVGGTEFYYVGDIGEIIIYTRALRDEERVAVEDYLIKKWGINRYQPVS